MVRLRAMVGIGVLLATFALAGQAGEGSAGEWPQWRGPKRDAVCTETGLLQEWPEGGPKLLWTLDGLGRGYSSVSIVGGRLYTMGDLKQDGEEAQYIIAIDLASRKPAWTARVGRPHGDGGPRCTPTVHDGRVYAIGTDGDLVCVDAASGKEQWRKNFGKDFGGRMMSGWRYSESPLVDGQKLVCTPGGNDAALVALDKNTGETLWQAKVPNGVGGAGYSSVAVSEACGVRQYVQLTGRGIVSVAADDGRFLWRYTRVANGTANIPTPVAVGDYVFCSTAYGTGSALLKITKTGDDLKREEAYWLDKNTFQCHHGGFLLLGDYLYGAHGHNSGNPICIELKTGEIKWSERQPGGGSGAVLYADGHLYYRYQSNDVALIEANPEKYVLKSRFKLPRRPGMSGPGWAHPVIADGKLYLRHADVLFCYDVKAK